MASNLALRSLPVSGPAAERQYVRQPEIEIENETADLLIGLGEVAATVAGFSGIVAVLGVRSVDSLAALARLRLVNLLVISLSAVFFSFLPVVLDQFDLAPAALWSVSSASLAVLWVTLLLTIGRQVRRLSVDGPGAPRRWMLWVFLVLAVLTLGCQAANLAGLRGSPSGALYCVGVLALLAVAGLQFILLVVDTQDRPSPPSNKRS